MCFRLQCSHGYFELFNTHSQCNKPAIWQSLCSESAFREGVQLMYLRTTKVQLTQQVKDWNIYISNDRICIKSPFKPCWFDCVLYSWWHIWCHPCLARAYPAQTLCTTVLGRLKSFGLSQKSLIFKDSGSYGLSETRTTTKQTRNRLLGCLASNSCCHDQVLDCFDSAGPYIHTRTVN